MTYRDAIREFIRRYHVAGGKTDDPLAAERAKYRIQLDKGRIAGAPHASAPSPAALSSESSQRTDEE